MSKCLTSLGNYSYIFFSNSSKGLCNLGIALGMSTRLLGGGMPLIKGV